MGQLIAIEGIDNSGKTTLSKRLAEELGCPRLSFPDRTTALGGIIEDVLKSRTTLDKHSLHLLFTANRWEKQAEMDAILENTDLVIDRYIHSGIVYSMAAGLSKDWCTQNQQGLRKPDKVIYLKADPSVCAKRDHFGYDVFDNVAFLSNVSDYYDQVKEDDWCVIDATQTKFHVFEEALEFIQE